MTYEHISRFTSTQEMDNVGYLLFAVVISAHA